MTRHKSQHGSALIVLVIIVAALILGALGYTAWNNYSKKTGVTAHQPVDKRLTTSSEEDSITKALPNGHVATYPDTEGNRNITFRDAENGDPESVYIFISHKSYAEYLASLGQAQVDELCGPDDNLKALKNEIIFGMFNTSDKTMVPPQNGNCVQYIASTENPDMKLRESAQNVLDRITKDINDFIASVKIR